MLRMNTNFKCNLIKKIIVAMLSYFITISMAEISHMRITGIDIVLPCIFLFVYMVLFNVLKNIKKQDLKYACPLGVLFSISLVVGSHIDIDHASFTMIGITDIFYMVSLSIFFLTIILLLLNIMDKYHFHIKTPQNSKISIKYYWIYVGILLICWLPYYLTFFPGNVGKDTIESINMCLGNIPWTNHHPVAFTFLINTVLKLTSFIGNITVSIAIFSFLQMIVFAFTLSYLLIWLRKNNIRKEILYISLLFLALHPIIAMYSIYLTKDVMFSCMILLLTLKLFDVVKSNGKMLESKKDICIISGLSFGVILLRNNGLYIVIGVALCILFLYRSRWKRIIIAFGSVFLLTCIYKGPVFNLIGITNQSFAESASVPLQQIGYVIWKDGEISEADKDFLDELMPLERVKEIYEPGYADVYKFDKEFNDCFLNDNVSRFMGVWWNLLLDNFSLYIKAYLMQTVGYWHYGETNSVCTQGVVDNTLGIAQYDVINHAFGISLEPIFEKLVLVARKAPLLCILSSMAMQIFTVFLCVIAYLRQKKKEKILALLPCILLWISVMIASPAFCLLRYMFPFYILWPVFITEIMLKD